MKFFAASLAVLIHPLAWPGSLIERIVNFINPGWEFDQYSATPYFLVLVALATLGLFGDSNAFSLAGAYILTALEVLGLWCTVTVGLGRA